MVYEQAGVQGNVQRTPLSDAFYSQPNVDRNQNMIVCGAAAMGEKIGRQSDDELFIIMRAIFLQEAKHSKTLPIQAQVDALNKSIVDFCVPRIVKAKRAHCTYMQDANRPLRVLDRAIASTSKGEKQLMPQPWL